MFRVDCSRLRFLVIDDNGFMRRITRSLLHGFGTREVTEAEDGAAGLEAFATYLPDIVITDWSSEMLVKPISAKGLYLRIAKVVLNPRPFIRTENYFGPDRRHLVKAEAYKGRSAAANLLKSPSA